MARYRMTDVEYLDSKHGTAHAFMRGRDVVGYWSFCGGLRRNRAIASKAIAPNCVRCILSRLWREVSDNAK